MVQEKVRTAQGRLFRARRQKEPAGPRGLQRGCRDVSLAALPGGQLLKLGVGVNFLRPGEDRLQCWRRNRQHSINSQCGHGEHAMSSCTSGSFLLLLLGCSVGCLPHPGLSHGDS